MTWKASEQAICKSSTEFAYERIFRMDYWRCVWGLCEHVYIGYTARQWKYAIKTARGALSCSCLSAAKTLLRAPRPSKSCIYIGITCLDRDRAGCRNRPGPSSSARLALAGGSKGLQFRVFLHRRAAFHRRALSDRVSFFAWKLATPPSKTPFLAVVSAETSTWKIRDLESTFYAIWLVNLNLPTSKASYGPRPVDYFEGLGSHSQGVL